MRNIGCRRRRSGPRRVLGAVLLALFPALAWGSLKADEVVVFFPTAGYRAASGEGWVVPVHGWIYEPEEDSLVRSAALGLFRRMFGREWSTAEQARFGRRARLLFVDNQRGKQLVVQIGSVDEPVGSSTANGHVSGTVVVADRGLPAGSGGVLAYRAVTGPGDARVFSGAAQLVPAEGVSVISDLDDTVKLSEVTDRAKLLENTFLKEFEPVPGMAERYRGWAQGGASIHFVTASPWQLYPPLAAFFEQHGFPVSSIHMRSVRLKDSTALNLLEESDEVKLPAILELLDRYPGRRFVLVGDAGEADPELYAGVARSRPQQIAGIWIRDVGGDRAGPERLRACFAGLPPELWRLFRDGTDLPASLPAR